MADGALQLVPFAALSANGEGYLIVDHQVMSAPSASTLAAIAERESTRTPPSRSLAMLADPVFGASDPRVTGDDRGAGPPGAARSALPRSRYPRLKHSRTEADQIIALVDPDGALRLIDFEASREAVVDGDLRDYRIVHFATHGELNADQALLSRLVLSSVGPDGESQDGFVYAGDVFDLELGAELVVLSACESALGEEIRAEGMIGLPYAFLHAGASNVVATSWQVSDRNSAALMTAFYDHLMRGESPAAALQAAQLELLERQPWPYYWAGFGLVGAGS